MTIESPCTNICTLDETAGLCRGCGRSIAEIAGWATMSADQRQVVLRELPDRLTAAFPSGTARKEGHV